MAISVSGVIKNYLGNYIKTIEGDEPTSISEGDNTLLTFSSLDTFKDNMTLDNYTTKLDPKTPVYISMSDYTDDIDESKTSYDKTNPGYENFYIQTTPETKEATWNFDNVLLYANNYNILEPLTPENSYIDSLLIKCEYKAKDEQDYNDMLDYMDLIYFNPVDKVFPYFHETVDNFVNNLLNNNEYEYDPVGYYSLDNNNNVIYTKNAFLGLIGGVGENEPEKMMIRGGVDNVSKSLQYKTNFSFLGYKGHTGSNLRNYYNIQAILTHKNNNVIDIIIPIYMIDEEYIFEILYIDDNGIYSNYKLNGELSTWIINSKENGIYNNIIKICKSDDIFTKLIEQIGNIDSSYKLDLFIRTRKGNKKLLNPDINNNETYPNTDEYLEFLHEGISKYLLKSEIPIKVDGSLEYDFYNKKNIFTEDKDGKKLYYLIRNLYKIKGEYKIPYVKNIPDKHVYIIFKEYYNNIFNPGVVPKEYKSDKYKHEIYNEFVNINYKILQGLFLDNKSINNIDKTYFVKTILSNQKEIVGTDKKPLNHKILDSLNEYSKSLGSNDTQLKELTFFKIPNNNIQYSDLYNLFYDIENATSLPSDDMFYFISNPHYKKISFDISNKYNSKILNHRIESIKWPNYKQRLKSCLYNVYYYAKHYRRKTLREYLIDEKVNTDILNNYSNQDILDDEFKYIKKFQLKDLYNEFNRYILELDIINGNKNAVSKATSNNIINQLLTKDNYLKFQYLHNSSLKEFNYTYFNSDDFEFEKKSYDENGNEITNPVNYNGIIIERCILNSDPNKRGKLKDIFFHVIINLGRKIESKFYRTEYSYKAGDLDMMYSTLNGNDYKTEPENIKGLPVNEPDDKDNIIKLGFRVDETEINKILE